MKSLLKKISILSVLASVIGFINLIFLTQSEDGNGEVLFFITSYLALLTGICYFLVDYKECNIKKKIEKVLLVIFLLVLGYFLTVLCVNNFNEIDTFELVEKYSLGAFWILCLDLFGLVVLFFSSKK